MILPIGRHNYNLYVFNSIISKTVNCLTNSPTIVSFLVLEFFSSQALVIISWGIPAVSRCWVYIFILVSILCLPKKCTQSWCKEFLNKEITDNHVCFSVPLKSASKEGNQNLESSYMLYTG
jgi:hypothetical protein